ncbi:MAG: hypothetical protein COU07_00705 [Candidatus Harrisonbacteria bacterium CG10_big_fil_rev_8_21_14_0_10_40_38]|uniref:Uncharacterized protein n=1 Tax=Candidatus Harrisonbacteria bacterium CG10_big_fil_rev_8_21_14_0_10_40_38 TaxID=1974583 RepID=A0A2H0UUH0_9BACT|nr:MAG: hypothetical protein COU07_00705 [Candidatus Harrisonbacteria bacterium CG10_big_fil_rev_8_21_14_0_10_40_38]
MSSNRLEDACAEIDAFMKRSDIDAEALIDEADRIAVDLDESEEKDFFRFLRKKCREDARSRGTTH